MGDRQKSSRAKGDEGLPYQPKRRSNEVSYELFHRNLGIK